ncbi:MAG TPA: segregation/condensation protein A [Acidimicrobiales bacterium]|nr:segregation/condensation protein A [Acidimicrobiales bacterium]
MTVPVVERAVGDRAEGAPRADAPVADGGARCLVHTPVFEGPFDLLLHLILREQVDIYEISLATIVDAYLAELDRMTQSDAALDLDVATEFLLIAATLIELKARRLLPGRDDIELDDELALWEERDVLLARLLECKTFKDAARALTRLSDDAGRSFPRRAGLEERFLDLTPDLLANVQPADLKAAFLRAVSPKPVPRVDLFHVTDIRANVTDAVAELLDELPRARRITFRRLTASLMDRIEVVVRFLALLELFKQGLVEIDQAMAFGDIDIVWIGGDGADEGLALAAIDVYDG